jgi:signal transduction histidine kinase/CheY-like chemotaxis protein/HPt (histidine-containing phosphotransfer) domain-containing protein
LSLFVFFAVAFASASAAESTEAAPGQAIATVYDAEVTAVKGDVRAVTRASDGTLLVGSNVLAAFDGAHWQEIEIPGAYAFRALAPAAAPDARRVWVGGFGAIGFVESDARGAWRFTSLHTPLAAAGLSTVSDVWAVRSLGTGAVWVTTDRALRWTPDASGASGHFEIWSLPAHSRLNAFGGGASVWVHQDGIGLWRFEPAGAPRLVLHDPDLPESPITWMLPAETPAETSWLGLKDAAYEWSETEGFRRHAALSDVLKNSVPTDAAHLPGGRIAVATFDDGIVMAGREGRPVTRYSTDRGLPDRSVYSLFGDGSRLWLATPQGVVRLDAPGQTRLFDRHAALSDGQPLTVLQHESNLAVLTSRNLLRAAAAGSELEIRFEPVLAARGVFMDAGLSADAIWVGGFGGIWRVTGEQARQEVFVPTDITRTCATRRFPAGRLFLEDYRLGLLLPSAHGGWAVHELDAAVSDSPVSLLEDRDGRVWVSTMQKGVLRFRWDDASPSQPRLRIEKAYRFGSGLPADAGRVELMTLGDRLFAFAESGILALREDQLAFEPVAALEAFVGLAGSRGPAANPSHVAHWLVQARALAGSGTFAVLRAELDPHGVLSAHPLDVPGLDAIGHPSMLALAGDALWIGGSRGLLQVETSALAPALPPPAPPLQIQNDGRAPGTFAFQFALPSGAEGEPLYYQARLRRGGAGEWSAPFRESDRKLESLGAGDYEFEVRAVDRFGRAGPAAARHFLVAPPWWQTVPAFAGYAGLLLVAVGGAARWRLLRLRRQNERLNRLVAERTREIELASTAKSEFLDNVSHEIRNPLNGLTGLLALLKENRLDARERELARSLKSVASTLTQVFEDVLQFSKLEYGYGRLDRQNFALRPLLEEIVSLFALQSQQAGCALEVHWPVELVDGFEGDPAKIKTVVINFVSNALKYAPGTPIEIRVGVTGESHGVVQLFIGVTDHGPGIPAEEQELVFRKFVRGRRARESRVPGTGLGLATCHMLAQLMNGSVDVESAPGRGSTFHLNLNLPRAALAETGALADDAVSSPSTAGPILIVEDEPYNRMVLEGIARELGGAADSVGSAAEALERLAAKDYPVILLDWELPDGNGGEIARHVRRRHTDRPPLVLATTAHDSDEMRQRCLAAGMDGFVVKPYSVASVRQAIADAQTPPSSSDSKPVVGAGLGPDELDLTAFAFLPATSLGQAEEAWAPFGDALDAHLSVIASALSTGNTEEVRREAHRLRALSGLVHAVPLNRAAAQLEAAARNGTVRECEVAWPAVSGAAGQLKAQLAAFARRVTPAPRSRDGRA